ncbi:c-type cytochrome [Erythrobacter sp. WG]|uniref:c-type cytochrome n=1 Tax=Erythrobacter sp. WG TaxID=2985510 RepID=UPI0022720821|nr:cytochrome c [Erythrobacter sp. WG]MCX9148537.1 cytochrome c [Erythrobacter sp. WG]
MLRTTAPRLLTAAALAGVLSAASAGLADRAVAQGQAKPSAAALAKVTERQENFKAIGGAFKAVRGELEKDSPDYALIAAKAGDINARARRVGGLFPAGTSTASGIKTEALPAIWSKPDAFKAAAQKLVDESGKLKTAAATRNKQAVAAQAMALGGACKGCHDQFRLPAK